MSSSDSPSRVRVTLLNVDNGQKAAVVLKSDYNAIVAACKNKLRKRAKGKSPLYLWTSSPGITLLSESTIESVVDGKTIYVANFPPQECEGDDETQQEINVVASDGRLLHSAADVSTPRLCTGTDDDTTQPQHTQLITQHLQPKSQSVPSPDTPPQRRTHTHTPPQRRTHTHTPPQRCTHTHTPPQSHTQTQTHTRADRSSNTDGQSQTANNQPVALEQPGTQTKPHTQHQTHTESHAQQQPPTHTYSPSQQPTQHTHQQHPSPSQAQSTAPPQQRAAQQPHTRTHHRPPANGYLTFDWFSCVEGRGTELHYTWVESDVPPQMSRNTPQPSDKGNSTKQRNNGPRNGKGTKRNGRTMYSNRDYPRTAREQQPTVSGRQFVARLDTVLPQSAAFAVGMTIAAWLLMGYDADVVVVRCGSLCAAQVAFWNDLYRGALSEFYYINDLVVPQFTIISEGPDIAPHDPPQQTKTPHKKRALVPLGGGKDSLVALERMRTSGYDCTLLYVGGEPGEFEASWRLSALIAATGCTHVLVELDLGDCWTAASEGDKADVDPITPPYSALVAFVAAGVAASQGFDYIAVGNESSANEGNGLFVWGEGGDVVVNHQYDKSLDCELRMSSYITNHVYADVLYFSALMDVCELQIAEAFCRLPHYHALFISCNEPIATTRWCGQCPKCAFVFVLLSAFLDPPQPWAVFGDNLFAKEALWPEFEALMGLGEHKPFECVGTAEETFVALKKARSRYKATYPNMDLPQFFNLHQRTLDRTPDAMKHTVASTAADEQHAIPEDVVPLSQV